MKKMKFILGSIALITAAASVITLSATSNADQMNKPNSIDYVNKNKMTFSNPRHYQYNFKDGTLKDNNYFNEWFDPITYGAADYSIATVKLKNELENIKSSNQDQWYEDEQEWEMAFNRVPTFLVNEHPSQGKNIWSNDPRFGIVISKSLELVEGSMKITIYKSTKSEEVYKQFNAPIPISPKDRNTNTDDPDPNGFYDLQFKRDDIITDIPIPNEYGYDWKASLTDFNRWTSWLVTWENKPWRLEPTWAVNRIYKELFYSWNNGYGPDNQPIRAHWSWDWRTELEENLEHRRNRFLYPPRDMAEGSMDTREGWQHSKKLQDNIGTIFSFRYNTGLKSLIHDYTDQNWFKVTFKTRKNKLMFDNNNAGGLAYVMATFTTFDRNTHVYSFNWKAADINPQTQNYSIDVKESISGTNEYPLPKLTYDLVLSGSTGTTTKVIPSGTLGLKYLAAREKAQQWYSRTYNSLDLDKLKEFWSNGETNLFAQWQLRPKFGDFDDDFWKIKQVAKIDPNDPTRLVFDVEYSIDEFKLERIKAYKAVADFKNINVWQRSTFQNMIKRSNDINQIHELIDVNNDNNGKIKTIDQKMEKLWAIVKDADKFQNSNYFNSYDPKYTEPFKEAISEIKKALKSNFWEPDIDKSIAKVETLYKYFKALEMTNNSTDLSDKQKEHLKEEINQVISASEDQKSSQVKNQELDKLLDEATQLDNLMHKINDLADKSETAKNSQDYNEADQNLKDQLNQALENAKNAKEEFSVDKVKELYDSLKDAYDKVIGNKALNHLKNQAKAALDSLIYLNETQKQDALSKIDNATSDEEVHSIIKIGDNPKQNIDLVNDQMQKLRSLIQVAQKIKVPGNQNYEQAKPDAKVAFDRAFAKTQDQLESLNDDLNKVKALVDELTSAIEALDGISNLDAAKTKAIDQIRDSSDFIHLNVLQKDYLVAQINAKNSLDGIKAIVDYESNNDGSAKELDSLMKELQDELQKSQKIQISGKYLNASVDKKSDFDTAYANAKAESEHRIDAEVAAQITQQLKAAREALDGSVDQREDLINKVTNDENLSDALKEKINELINNATDKEKLNEIDQLVDALSTKLQELVAIQNKAIETTNGAEYKNATPVTQKGLDDQIVINRGFIEDNTANEEYYNLEDVSLINNQIDKLINQTKEAIDALRSESQNNLNQAQTTAANELYQMIYLNDAQMNDFASRINSSDSIANNINSVNEIIQEARKTNSQMHQLFDYVEKTIEKDNNINPLQEHKYLDADTKLQENFANAYRRATLLLDKRNGSNLSESEVFDLYNLLHEAYKALNGDDKRDARISKLNSLVEDAEKVRKSSKYLDVNTEKQKAYDEAIEHAKEILSNQNNYSLDEIEEAIKKITQSLDIIENSKEDVKDRIDELPNLSDSEKDYYKDLVTQSENIEAAVEINEQANRINDKKQDLIDLINKQNNLSDQDKTDLVNQIRNQTFNHVSEFEEKEKMITELDELIEKLTNPLINTRLWDDDINYILDKIDRSGISNPDYAKIGNAIKDLNKIKAALNEFDDSNAKSEEFSKIREKLITSIKEVNEYEIASPDMQAVYELIKKQDKLISELAYAEIELVDALLNKDKNTFEVALGKIQQIKPWAFADFKDSLDRNNYFEIVNKDPNQITPEDTSKLNKILKKDATNVIFSALDLVKNNSNSNNNSNNNNTSETPEEGNANNENKNSPDDKQKDDGLSASWFILLVLCSLGLFGIAYLLFKKFKN